MLTRDMMPFGHQVTDRGGDLVRLTEPPDGDEANQLFNCHPSSLFVRKR